MKGRWPIILAFALFFAFVWPTPYSSNKTEPNRINRVMGGKSGHDISYYLGEPLPIVWLLAWLGIGAVIGYGVTVLVTWKSSTPEERREK